MKPNKLRGRQAVMQNLLSNDPNWKSPVQRVNQEDTVISLAQYVNKYGVPNGNISVRAEVGGMGWVDAIACDFDMERDKKDPYNMGYWHNSKVRIIYDVPNGLKATWHPFSMVLVDISLPINKTKIDEQSTATAGRSAGNSKND